METRSIFNQECSLLLQTKLSMKKTMKLYIDRMSGNLHCFTSIGTVDDLDDATMFPTEYFYALSLSGLPEHELNLKVNTVVILLINMDIKEGHCN